MNPYVFVCGCHRSGTTLLGRLANAHPQLAVFNETRWIARWYVARVGLTPEGYVTPRLIEELRAFPRFQKLDLPDDAARALLADDPPVPYARFISGIFDLYGRQQGKELVGDKTPHYVRFIDLLHGFWAHARFVHIIRDGRDVTLSTLDWAKGPARGFPALWARDPVVTSALWWDSHVRVGRETGARLGPGLYQEVRYEALVADPARECAALCDFLDLPFDEAMLRFHEGREKDKPDLDAKRAWRPVTAGLRDWRTAMAPADVEAFEAVAGPLLEELGYERAHPHPGPEAMQRAAALTPEFRRHSAARHRRLPTESPG